MEALGGNLKNREVRRLHQQVMNAPMYRYGSFTPGRLDWEAKWDLSPGRRILIYCLRDYGSLYRWAEAINECTTYAARLVSFYPHPYGFPLDLLMPYPDVTERSKFQDLVSEATVIHEKHELAFFDGKNRLNEAHFAASGKPRIYTAYGGQMRKFQNVPDFRKYVHSYDYRVALTPDLNYDWFDGVVVPQAIDANQNVYSWEDGRLLAHSPSTPKRKGTSDLLEAVAGFDIELDLITGVSFEESIRRKGQSSLFFDQAGRELEEFLGVTTVIGWYGNSAIEAAVHGIPTIAHLSPEAFEGADRAGRSDIRIQCGIINTPRGADGIRQTLQDYFDRSEQERQEISLKTRRWVEEFHSYEAVGEALSKVYDSLI